ncbi:hypothetical protein B9G69_003970 [Bdellovibrio sp. SKB1291214]|uniref:hypothetical protein n=1 Tax=Bdellovibrio sp. SKB1291214 TaxID=1732569 RepID=UPI000B51D818|nr:hypothetical protein [Bdellovibrio sp. SKB1291214]UYL09730.1 hypothetical protein B9G69_003970 [Bdellovibrio sp. SKB1291214]
MTKRSSPPATNPHVQNFIEDLQLLSSLPTSKKHSKIALTEYPLDEQLLHASSLYRASREMYLELGGVFEAKLCSTMRSLSAQDLFADVIQYSPSWSELLWFKDHSHELADPDKELEALGRFNEISLYHEQNHRVLWRLLPPAPKDATAFRRYLNFAESLVVVLDLALGDELGKKHSPIFEDLKVIYRSGGEHSYHTKDLQTYRKYLLSMVCATYCTLELVNPEDVVKVVDYVFPGQKKMNKDATTRSLEINELFTRVTNPQWQERYWQKAQKKLARLHKPSKEPTFHLAADPLDMEHEFAVALRVFEYYGI